MWGAGTIRLVKKMERVHSYALRWITGTFHTSPIGSRELVASIPPLKIILNLRLRGAAAQVTSLGEEHSLSRSLALRWLPNAIASTTPRRRARHLPTNNPLSRLSTSAIKEQFSLSIPYPDRASAYQTSFLIAFSLTFQLPNAHLNSSTHGSETSRIESTPSRSQAVPSSFPTVPIGLRPLDLLTRSPRSTTLHGTTHQVGVQRGRLMMPK